MPEYTIRDWKGEDRPALKSLWKRCFGDDDAFIDGFMDAYLKPGACIVAEADGAVVSAMYIIPGLPVTLSRRRAMTAGYTYALATHPDCRGRGIGSAVYRACCERVLAAADAAFVIPTDGTLFPLYEKANGAQPLAYMREARIPRTELKDIPSCQAVRFPADRYGGLRENLLIGLPHVTFDAELYELLEEAGVEFFMLENGLAAAETLDGVCYIRELLCTGSDPMTAVAAVARWCPAEVYVVRTPLFFDGPGKERPYALGVFAAAPDRPLPEDLWWGFGLE